MTQQEILVAIHKALNKALDEPPEVTLETDLIGEEILDSLDSMVFILELEKLSSKKFPEEDLEENGFFHVQKLVEFLSD